MDKTLLKQAAGQDARTARVAPECAADSVVRHYTDRVAGQPTVSLRLIGHSYAVFEARISVTPLGGPRGIRPGVPESHHQRLTAARGTWQTTGLGKRGFQAK